MELSPPSKPPDDDEPAQSSDDFGFNPVLLAGFLLALYLLYLAFWCMNKLLRLSGLIQ